MFIKSFIFSTLWCLGIFDISRFFQRNKVIILMYHRFSDKNEPFKVNQKVFENQIQFLRKKYNFISLTHYAEFLNGQKTDLPNNPIIITIDDGFKDNYDFAYPVLKKYSIPATIFITFDFINDKKWLWFNKLKYILQQTKYKTFNFQLGSHTKQFYLNSVESQRNARLTIFNYCKSIRSSEIDVLLNHLSETLKVPTPAQSSGDFLPLTWEQIKEMQKSHIEFGSHTCSHPILSKMKYDQLKKEIILSRKEISLKIGSEVSSFCYPVGTPEDINDDVIQITKEAGYSCAVTTIPGSNHVRKINRFLLKRIPITTDCQVKLSKIITFS